MNLQHVRSELTSGINPVIECGGKTRPSSVLVVIYGDEPRVLMTQKPRDLKVHAGEISFPGGKPEESDRDLLETALRETREEVGVSVPRDKVTGQLEHVTTLNSGFTILPFVAIVEEISGLLANAEVEKIFEVPLLPLLRTMADDPHHQSSERMLAFSFGDKTVWGASARILGQMAKRLKI